MGREGPGWAPPDAPFLLVPGEDGEPAAVEGASIARQPSDPALDQDRQRAATHVFVFAHCDGGVHGGVWGHHALREVQGAMTPWPLRGPVPGSWLPDTRRKEENESGKSRSRKEARDPRMIRTQQQGTEAVGWGSRWPQRTSEAFKQWE